jgi:AcrR family transcriptional regulator
MGVPDSGQHGVVGPKSPLRRSPVQARAKERIERVLDAAEEVFVSVGYEAATTNQIAAQADTSIGSIYEFFGNKQALAKALAERYLDELNDLYDEVVVDDPGGRDAIVAKVVDALDEFYTKHPGLGPLLRGCRGSEDLQAAGQSLQASLIAHVDNLIAQRRGMADPARRHVVAEMCADVLRCVLDEVADKPDAERKELVAELKLVLISYLTVALPRA